MFHEIIVLGKLIRSTPRYTPSGTSVNNFTLAVETGTGDDKKTIWINCTCFGKTADFLLEHGQKGMVVLVTGELSPDVNGGPRVYQAKDGEMRASYDVTVKTLRVAKWPNLSAEAEAATMKETTLKRDDAPPF